VAWTDSFNQQENHMQTYKGSCLCQAVSFELNGDFSGFYLCHCSRCRKETGSAYASNLFSRNGSLHWISGKDTVRTFELAGTRFAKTFCTACGSTLPTEKSGYILVPAGSIDGDVARRPDAHIFMGSKADWDHDLAGVPCHDTFPG
jgi:hypothetical protein